MAERDQGTDQQLAAQVSAQVRRKLWARRPGAQGVWFGFGMMGLIGWSVVLPTLLGAALGAWLDKHFATRQSWTLALLMAGLVLGCFVAGHWVVKEERAMRQERGGDQHGRE